MVDSGLSQTIPAVLTIAGSDPSGGAGIQADLKTFTALKCYGTSVITALTAQNTIGVQAVHRCPPSFVEQQLTSVLDDVDIRAIKTGMLYDAEAIHAIATKLRSHYGENLPPLVCDPVSVSTSGHTLLASDAIEVLAREIFPFATLITPNKSEAELILSRFGLASSPISNVEEMISACTKLLSFGSRAVLLKGGHLITTITEIRRISHTVPEVSIITDGVLGENMEILQLNKDNRSDSLVVDVLRFQDEILAPILFVRPRVQSTSTHGTGCTLSAAITCGLAQGLDLQKAVKLAASYTHRGIEHSFPLGGGNGPLNHLHCVIQRLIPSATKSNPYPLSRSLIESTQQIWKQYVEHKFVKEIGKGTLDMRCFIHFVKQDYLYLKYYARAYALLAAKSSDFSSIELATRTIQNVLHEVSTNHKAFCSQLGVQEKELESAQESSATTAYGAFIMDVGFQGDSSKLTMALAACLLGYGEVGLWLIHESKRASSWVILDEKINPYVGWIRSYSGERYQEAVKIGLAAIEMIAEKDPPTQRKMDEWRDVWERCVWLEKSFWDMAMNLS